MSSLHSSSSSSSSAPSAPVCISFGSTRLVPVSSFTIGVISALPKERVAVEALFDEEYADLPRQLGDNNSYGFGRIGKKNVITCSLPSGVYGEESAATVATHMVRSFPHLQYYFVVGIAGGAPAPNADIRLGDVVIGEGSPLMYSMGRQEGPTINDFKINRAFTPYPTNSYLGSVHSTLVSKYTRRGWNDFYTLIKRVAANIEDPQARVKYQRPTSKDVLFQSHIHYDEEKKLQPTDDNTVPREPRDPAITSGIIASADTVMKWATVRDDIAKAHKVLCFEMEAGGAAIALDKYMIIRGICDYADSHKNKEWQEYAAATAAAAFVLLLQHVDLNPITGFSNDQSQSQSLPQQTSVLTSVSPMSYNQFDSDLRTVKMMDREKIIPFILEVVKLLKKVNRTWATENHLLDFQAIDRLVDFETSLPFKMFNLNRNTPQFRAAFEVIERGVNTSEVLKSVSATGMTTDVHTTLVMAEYAADYNSTRSVFALMGYLFLHFHKNPGQPEIAQFNEFVACTYSVACSILNELERFLVNWECNFHSQLPLKMSR